MLTFFLCFTLWSQLSVYVYILPLKAVPEPENVQNFYTKLKNIEFCSYFCNFAQICLRFAQIFARNCAVLHENLLSVERSFNSVCINHLNYFLSCWLEIVIKYRLKLFYFYCSFLFIFNETFHFDLEIYMFRILY